MTKATRLCFGVYLPPLARKTVERKRHAGESTSCAWINCMHGRQVFWGEGHGNLHAKQTHTGHQSKIVIFPKQQFVLTTLLFQKCISIGKAPIVEWKASVGRDTRFPFELIIKQSPELVWDWRFDFPRTFWTPQPHLHQQIKTISDTSLVISSTWIRISKWYLSKSSSSLCHW